MNRSVDECVNWAVQQHDFVPDGSLRDIYVRRTSLEDWRSVLRLIEEGPYRAQLTSEGSTMPFPRDVEALFAPDVPRPLLSLSVSGVLLVCHFFVPEEIEFDLDPRQVTEERLRQLLCFMAELGDVTGKAVVMSPENAPELSFFRYDPAPQHMTWVPPPST